MQSATVVVVGDYDVVFDPVEARLRAAGCDVVRYGTHEQFLEDPRALEGAQVLYSLGHLPLDRTTLIGRPALRAVISAIAGTEGFPKNTATELGIVIGNVQPAKNNASMAEATIMLMLVCLYDLHASEMRLRSGSWYAGVTGRMLAGRTVGLVGFGRIAQAIAERLSAWGTRIQFYAPRLHGEVPEFARPVELDELLSTSDIVCVLASLNDETKGLLDARRLALTRSGSIFINVARGGIVDEDALVALARRGHFAKIALDVFRSEPLPLDHPLLSLPNAILTPHGVGHTIDALESVIESGVESVLRVLRGEPPLFVCNPEVLAVWLRRWSTTNDEAFHENRN